MLLPQDDGGKAMPRGLASLEVVDPQPMQAESKGDGRGRPRAALLGAPCTICVAAALLAAAGAYLLRRGGATPGAGDGGGGVRAAPSKEACKAWASKLTRLHDGSDEDLRGKRNCDALASKGDALENPNYIYDYMDKDLDESLVTTRDADPMPVWTVRRPGLPEEPRGDPVEVEFGRARWWIPAGLSAEDSRDRVLFVHGCTSECSTLELYYTNMVSRLAHHLQMPVLAGNYAHEPEYPWPHNVKSALALVEYIAANGPDGKEPIRNLFLVGDSEGGLVTMQLVIMLVNESAPALHGVLPSLQARGTAAGTLPLAGVILYSPTLDLECAGESFHRNCWDDGSGAVDAARDGPRRGWTGAMAGACDNTTADERVYLCQWSYVLYFFGLEEGSKARDVLEAHQQYAARSASFWRDPLVNPLMIDFSAKGAPPILIVTGEEDYFASDSIALAARACETGGDVEHFHAAGMWHDFQQYSEGCGGAAPIPEGIEAYRRSGRWARARRHRATPEGGGAAASGRAPSQRLRRLTETAS